MSSLSMSFLRRHETRKPAPAPRAFRPAPEALDDPAAPAGPGVTRDTGSLFMGLAALALTWGVILALALLAEALR